MPAIQVLSQETIDKIAAGEVIERPASVIKELVENSIDAKSTAITVEIRDGGTSFIRVTDNGCGIAKDEIALAFLRHSTSKITSAEDLHSIATLGFRGEALSSIAAVAQVELLTKTRDDFTGIRYCVEGGIEKSIEEVGTPDGTTFLVRNLFYNTPARKKFLKTNTTEGNYVQDLIERLALSHPEISFKLIMNNQSKLHTSGNTNLKDIIYQIYGRDIAANVIPVSFESDEVTVSGFIGKPVVSRGNRQYENYFINGRYVKNNIVTKAIEDGYKSYMMQHQYPFTVIHTWFHTDNLDVNVHPTKLELRFSNGEKVYQLFYHVVNEALKRQELVVDVQLQDRDKKAEPKTQKSVNRAPEIFEKHRIAKLKEGHAQKAEEYQQKTQTEEQAQQEQRNQQQVQTENRPLMPSRDTSRISEGSKLLERIHSVAGQIKPEDEQKNQSLAPPMSERVSESAWNRKVQEDSQILGNSINMAFEKESVNEKLNEKSGQNIEGTDVEQSQLYGNQEMLSVENADKVMEENQYTAQIQPQQLTLYEEHIIERRIEQEIQIIGQVFDTYWIIQFEDKMFIIDQHAAHEKVLYERTVAQLKDKQVTSQLLSPPMILTLSAKEMELLEEYRSEFEQLGFSMESFGGKEYAINAVPANLFNLQAKDLFLEMLDSLSDELGHTKQDMILDKIASMSCKAAIKGGHQISRAEAEELLRELMSLENPYHCPHGRPVIISMSKYELEKKFKRIV